MAQAAFSLVEVVLAVGIAGFGLIVILGLFPAGLNANRDSAADTRSVEIAQKIFATIRGQNFTNVSFYGTTINLTTKSGVQTFYADGNGQNITSSSSSTNVYYINATFTNAPSGFTSGTANLVTLEIMQGSTNQSKKTYMSLFY